jgi:hypothetical protein
MLISIPCTFLFVKKQFLDLNNIPPPTVKHDEYSHSEGGKVRGIVF